jgi:hypothetical protein
VNDDDIFACGENGYAEDGNRSAWCHYDGDKKPTKKRIKVKDGAGWGKIWAPTAKEVRELAHVVVDVNQMVGSAIAEVETYNANEKKVMKIWEEFIK